MPSETGGLLLKAVDVFNAAVWPSKLDVGHLLQDHVHMLISIPPKYAVSQVIGLIKGESVIHLARVLTDRGRVSDLAQPLRAAHNLKPPALPGDTYSFFLKKA
jgi:REP element-mobilizing transposase RayT